MTDVEARDENDDNTNLVTQESISSIDENNQRDWYRTWSSSFEFIGRVIHKYAHSAGRRIFGDKYGLALFCGALAFFMLYWRIGVMINDSYTIANGLVAVSEGHLYVDRAVYGPGLETPGMVEIDGRAYARNYGQIIAALPFLWLIQGVDAVADLRVALAGGWATLVLGLSILVGDLLDREIFERDSRVVTTYIGGVIGLVVFTLVVWGSTTIEPMWHHLIALQLQTMVAAGLTGVVLYRLLYRMHSRQIGLAAGAAVVFASPIGFWASFPKRHVLVALGVVISVYCLYRSREALCNGSNSTLHLEVVGKTVVTSEITRWRALAYIPVGFVAWVNPLEGVILLMALLAVDVPTGGRRIRSLVAAGCACVLSVVPMFITNSLITGSPLEPPTAHDFYGSGGLAEQGGGNGGATASSADGGGASSAAIDSFFGVLSIVERSVERGFTVISSEGETLLYVFVRSGYAKDIPNGGDALRLSFVEAMPLAAALVVIPIILWRINIRQRLWKISETRRLSSITTVDTLIVIYSMLAILMFLPRLPMQAELTVRYLLVLFPLGIYGTARLSPVQRLITEQSRMCIASYISGVFVGGQILFLYMYATGVVLEEAFKIHGYVGIGIGVIVAGWIIAAKNGYREDRVGGIILGLAAASSTVFILVMLGWYFANIGPLGLPIS